MQDKINGLKSKLILNIDTKEALVLEKKLQYRHVNELYQDAGKGETLVAERYAQVESQIDSLGEEVRCPLCRQNAEKLLSELKSELPGLESQLSTKHEETEWLSQRLFDIEMAINDLETEIHQAIRHNKQIEVEICFLQAQEQLQAVIT